MKIRATVLTLSLFVLASGAAQAALPFSHPAIAGHRSAPVEAGLQAQANSPVLVGHPASPQWVVVHANHEHPAVVAASQARGLDANHFLVQPPATTRWTEVPAVDTAAQIARQ